LSEKEELKKILTDILIKKQSNKTEMEDKLFRATSHLFRIFTHVSEPKKFHIIIDLPKPNIMSFYVINEDVGINPIVMTKSNQVRVYLNPSRVFVFNSDKLKVFKGILENEVELLHKRSQELYSAIKNIRPLLSPVVVSPYLYSSGLAKKERYYSEICHLDKTHHENPDSYSSYKFESTFKTFEENKEDFAYETQWVDPQIKGSKGYIREILSKCKLFEIESQDKLERSNKLTKILGFRVSEFKLYFKPASTKYLQRFQFNELNQHGMQNVIKNDSKFESVINFFVDYIRDIDEFLIIDRGFIEVVGNCHDLIDELNEQYPLKTLGLEPDKDFVFNLARHDIVFTISNDPKGGYCRLKINS